MADNIVFRTITIRGTSEGLDELTSKLKVIAAEEKNIAVVSDDLTKRQISLAAAWKATGLRLDESARSVSIFSRLVKESSDFLKQGGIDAQMHADRVAQLTQRYDQAGVAAQRMITGMSGLKVVATQAAEVSKPFDKLTTGMSAAGAAGSEASQRMVAGMSAMGKEAGAAAPQIDRVTVSSAAMTKQSSRNAAEMLNLGRQFADVGVSLQAGQSLLTVGIQQGAQIIDVFASSGRTAGQIFSQAASWAGRFVTSTAGVVTGIGAIALGAVGLASSWQEGQREIDKALIGVGKRAGVTKGDLTGLAEANASTARLSISEWRGAALEFVKTGTIYGENVAGLTNLVKGFANTIGESSEDAAKQLAKIFSGDASSAADQLNAIYGNISGKTREFVRDLEVAGKRQEAIGVIIKEMKTPIQDAEKITGFWAASWDKISRTAKDIADSTGKYLSGVTGIGQTDQIRLDNLEKELKLTEEIMRKREERAESFRQKGATEGQIKLLVPELEPAVAQVDRLLVEYAKLKKEIKDAAAEAEQSQLIKLGNDADAASKAFLPLIEQLRDTEKLLNKIKEARSAEAQGKDPRRGMGGQDLAALNAGEVRASNLRSEIEMAARLNAYKVELLKVEQESVKVGGAREGQEASTNIAVLMQLDTLQRQLPVAQAVGQMAQIEAQHRARIGELSKTLKESEATRIADAERLGQLAQIEAQHKQTMVGLQGQLSVAEQVTGIGQINAQYDATVASLTLQIGLEKAIEQATLQRQIALAGVNADADRQLKTLQQEGQLIRANSASEEDSIRAQQTYQNLVDKGVEKRKAAAVASQQRSNSEEAREKRARAAEEQAIANIKTREDAWRAYNTTFENTGRGLISWSVANDLAGASQARLAQASEDTNYWLKQAASSMFSFEQAALQANTAFIPFATTWKSLGPTSLGTGGSPFTSNQGGLSQFNPAGYTSGGAAAAGGRSGTASGGYTSSEGEMPKQKTMQEIGAELWGEGNTTSSGAPTKEYLYSTAMLQFFSAVGNAKDVANLFAGGAVDPGILGQAPGNLAARGFGGETTRQTLNNLASVVAGGKMTFESGPVGAPWLGPSSTSTFGVNLASQEGQGVMSRLINLLPDPDKISVLQSEIAKISRENLPSVAREEVLKSLNDQLKQLTDATKENTDAMNAQLDPLFSQGHEFINQLKIGYYKAAEGGIFGPGGPVSLMPVNRYASGGIANSTQMAMFGEAGPEAFIPLKGGAVPVTIKGGMAASNDNSRNIVQHITINIEGGSTPTERFTARQRAQGFIAAAAQAAG